jgi:hypothetical protein
MIDWLVVATLAGPVLGVLIGLAISRGIEARERLVAYYGHVSSFRVNVDPEPFWVHTHNVVVRNSGRRAANNVRLGHAVLPQNYNILPDKQHDILELPGGTREIVITRLLPGEEVTVAYLYPPPVTWDKVNTYVKSDEGFARVITVLPQQRYPQWVNVTVGVLMLIGLITIMYLVAATLRWLIL